MSGARTVFSGRAWRGRQLAAPSAPRSGAACAPWRGRAVPRRVDRHRFVENRVGVDDIRCLEHRGRGVGDESGFGHFGLERRVGLRQPVHRHAVHVPLQRRSLEHAQAATPIALDAHEAVALQGLQQIHQPAKSVAALVEPAVGLAEDLFDVAQIHRPARVGGGGQDFRRPRHPVGRAFCGHHGFRRCGCGLGGPDVRRRFGGPDVDGRVSDRRFHHGVRGGGLAVAPVQLDHHAAPGVLQRDHAFLRQLFCEIEE
jgi:hypothetical protein